MTVSNIKAADGMERKSAGGQNAGFLSIGKKGQIVTGEITRTEGGSVTIRFGNKEVQTSAETLRDAKAGETRQFEITDVSEKGISLKETGRAEETGTSHGIYCTSVKMDKAAAAVSQDGAALETDQTEEKAKEAKESLSDAGNRMSGEDLEDLEEEGISIEKYNMDRLDRALQRIKDQRSGRKEAVESENQKKQNYREQIEKASEAGVIRNPRQEKIAEKLLEADLPVTQDNIAKIENALAQAQASSSMTDSSMRYLIANDMEPTVENIYHARYAGVGGKYSSHPSAGKGYQNSYVAYTPEAGGTQAPDADAWEEVLPQARKILEEAGKPVNETTLRQAEWLFSNDLPVTKENLDALQELEAIREGMGGEEALDRVIRAMERGGRPEQASMGSTEENAAGTVREFLEQLKQLEASMAGSTEIAQITARRQIEEIRLKLTTEAGQKLLAKGIKLDTTDLTKVVEGLREQENEYYRRLLQEAGASAEDSNVALLRETTEKADALKAAPSYVLGSTLANRRVQTVNTLYETGREMKASLLEAGERYETLMTKPRRDMGDSIQKAFRNVDAILKEMDLDTTQANRRAVKILGYNHMEITEDSILSVKAYDAQVNELLNGLHPQVAVQMIKDGFNPLDMPLSELNSRIEAQKKEMGIDGEQKYSEFLWKLDRENPLNEEERKAFIGIYRLLNQVEKADGAAVGALVDTGQEVTLNHLLTAVRTRKSKGIDKEIDDSFGSLEKVNRKEESISDQVAYLSRLVTNIRDQFEAASFRGTAGPEGDFSEQLNRFMDMPLEQLNERLSQAEGDPELDRAYNTSRLEKLRELAQNADSEIGFLTRHDQPVTMENLTGARQLLSAGRDLFRGLLDRSDEQENGETDFRESLIGLSDSLTGPEQMNAAYDRVEEGMKAILEKEYENPVLTWEDLAALKNIGNGIELARSLGRREHYEIPILTGERITNVHLTVVKGEKESGRVHISMESEELGNMEAEFSIKDHTVRGYVLCDSQKGLKAFKEERENLTDAMEGFGLDVGQLDYGMDKSSREFYARSGSAGEGNTDTKTLYQAARAFIQGIKAAEGRQ